MDEEQHETADSEERDGYPAQLGQLHQALFDLPQPPQQLVLFLLSLLYLLLLLLPVLISRQDPDVAGLFGKGRGMS